MNMENFNHKTQSSHSNESTFFLVFICAFIKYLLRADHVLDFALALGAAEMRKIDSLYEAPIGCWTGTNIKSYTDIQGCLKVRGQGIG